jgi:hypothetical protein
VSAPLAPVIVRVEVPAFTLGLAFTVSVVPVAELAGLNEALVLAGKPLTENVTVPLKLTLLTTEIV